MNTISISEEEYFIVPQSGNIRFISDKNEFTLPLSATVENLIDFGYSTTKEELTLLAHNLATYMLINELVNMLDLSDEFNTKLYLQNKIKISPRSLSKYFMKQNTPYGYVNPDNMRKLHRDVITTIDKRFGYIPYEYNLSVRTLDELVVPFLKSSGDNYVSFYARYFNPKWYVDSSIYLMAGSMVDGTIVRLPAEMTIEELTSLEESYDDITHKIAGEMRKQNYEYIGQFASHVRGFRKITIKRS